MITTTKAKPLVEQALAARSFRQDLIASNIANIDTPFYKARDVNFESALLEKARQMYGKVYGSNQDLQLAHTNKSHLDSKNMDLAKTHANHLSGIDFIKNPKGSVFLRDGHMARNDANTVDLDIETTEMSKNAVMINALTQALKKQGMIFKSVIEASKKV